LQLARGKVEAGVLGASGVRLYALNRKAKDGKLHECHLEASGEQSKMQLKQCLPAAPALVTTNIYTSTSTASHPPVSLVAWSSRSSSLQLLRLAWPRFLSSKAELRLELESLEEVPEERKHTQRDEVEERRRDQFEERVHRVGAKLEALAIARLDLQGIVYAGYRIR
jgi:hypothetical protein